MKLRFGFEIIENLCNKYGTTIEIIDNTEKTEEQELVEDLIQIGRAYGVSDLSRFLVVDLKTKEQIKLKK